MMTVEEFARMSTPETGDYELADGELVLLPGANPMQAKSPRCSGRVDRTKVPVPFAPDIAVEVLAPSDMAGCSTSRTARLSASI